MKIAKQLLLWGNKKLDERIRKQRNAALEESPFSDEWYVKRWTTTAEDPDWKGYFFKACESPAEEKFLDAMILQFNLLPKDGLLASESFTLSLQAKIPPYRADFLIDDWLVVEIDGHAYHSSPAAVERDRLRDEIMEKSRLTVLRIPAKVVFNEPDHALAKVEMAFAVGRQPKALPEKFSEEPKWSFTRMRANLADKVSSIHQSVHRISEVRSALEPAKDAAWRERVAIDIAVCDAQRSIETEQFRKQSPEHARLFDENLKRIETAIDGLGSGEEVDDVIEPPPPAILSPPAHNIQEIDKEVQERFNALMIDRDKYLDNIKERIWSDPRMATYVERRLKELGCHSYWELLER